MNVARFPNGTETRTTGVELRAAGRRGLSGYAANFHVEARIGDNFTEVLLPGCFADSLASNPDLLLLADHDPTKVLSRTRSGLQVTENGKGLFFEVAELPNTTAANDALELVRSGTVGGCSFAFTVPPDGQRWTGTRRELRAVSLLELSIVSAWPAYSGTSVAVRARAAGQHEAARRLRLLALLGV